MKIAYLTIATLIASVALQSCGADGNHPGYEYMPNMYRSPYYDTYTENPVFWVKVCLYIIVGLISLYPTTTYILWAIPLSKNKLPVISENLVKRFRLIIMTELVGFAVIPFFATLMSRGIGLVQT